MTQQKNNVVGIGHNSNDNTLTKPLLKLGNALDVVWSTLVDLNNEEESLHEQRKSLSLIFDLQKNIEEKKGDKEEYDNRIHNADSEEFGDNPLNWEGEGY
jgi:predicted nuclease with TOPRIM domain